MAWRGQKYQRIEKDCKSSHTHKEAQQKRTQHSDRSAADVTKKVFTDETKINFCQNDEKRNDPKLSTASLKHAEGDVMAQAWLSAETCKLCLSIM